MNDDTNEYPLGPEGCCFPGQCCMPGQHYESECHTPEMLMAQEAAAAHRWLAGWYATKLHAINADVSFSSATGPLQSLCGAWVYETPRTEWAKRLVAAGPPRCKRCEKKVAQAMKSQSPVVGMEPTPAFLDWFNQSQWAGAGKDAGELAEAAWNACAQAAADTALNWKLFAKDQTGAGFYGAVLTLRTKTPNDHP